MLLALLLLACGAAGFPDATFAENAAARFLQTAQEPYRAGDHAGAAVAARRAAQAGSLIATYEIGYMYENGDGVPQSREQALRWFKIGAVRGCREGDRALV